jgi:Undecaprenyl-phosphate glucose phosphotransferase
MFLLGRLPHPSAGWAGREYARAAGATWSPRPISAPLLCTLLAIIDVGVITGSAIAAYAVWLLQDPYSTWREYAFVTAFGVLLAVNAFNLARLYDPALLHNRRVTLGRTAACWCVVAAILMTMSFLTKTSEDYSRIWALMWFSAALVGLLATRWLFMARVARWVDEGRLQRKVAIVGLGPLARKLATRFRQNSKSGIRLVGLFSDEGAPQGSPMQHVSFGGDLRQLNRIVRLGAVDTVIVAEEGASPDRLDDIFESLREVPADVRYCPGEMALRLNQHSISHYAGVPMINVVDRPLSEWRYVVKEIEDRVLGTLILLMISPVLLGIAALVKLDSRGPALFRQPRYGYNNQLVEIWKFRTMYHDREDSRAEQLTRQNDPRITRVGRFLRRWSLDELPQFINVFRGEMSIVGPRPHAVSAKAGGLLYQHAVPHYAARHRVKPGITGWAQINGWRGTTDTVRQIEKRVEHDMYYIEHWSVWLDLKIIVLTLFKGFSGRHAY